MGAGFIPLEFRRCRTDVSHPSSCSGCSRSDGNMGRWDHGKMGSWEGPGMGGSAQDLTAIPKFRSSSAEPTPPLGWLQNSFILILSGKSREGSSGLRDSGIYPLFPRKFLWVGCSSSCSKPGIWLQPGQTSQIPILRPWSFSSLGIPSGNIQPLRRCSKAHPELVFLPWMSRN